MTLPMKANTQRGAMMLEALIGILIFSAGILALIGMQALAIAHVADAKYRADASFYANQIIAEMWVDRANLANYEFNGSGTPPATIQAWVDRVTGTAGGNGLPGAASNLPIIDVTTATGHVSVEVRWQPPNATSVHTHRTIALIAAP
jgi:type IV pilus assembly protein PilV